VKQSGGQGVAALLIMVTFLILSVILLVYYIGRLVTLYIGAVLSPAVLLAWLIPGFRDFSEAAAKTYLTAIFVLFVHVVILQLAASLFVGMAAGSDNNVPDTLMAMVTGLATIVALLKTQGVMTQFSYVSGGARNARKLGGQFMNGVGYMTGKGKAAAVAAAGASDTVQKGRAVTQIEKRANSTGQPQLATIKSKKSNAEINVQASPSVSRSKTGTTTVAPRTKPESQIAKPSERSEKEK
jgi:type IV secretory pathway TrbL component